MSMPLQNSCDKAIEQGLSDDKSTIFFKTDYVTLLIYSIALAPKKEEKRILEILPAE